MMKNLITVLSSAALLMCASCSAVFSRGWMEEPELYPGTRFSGSVISGSKTTTETNQQSESDEEAAKFGLLGKTFFALDLPLTIIADTLFIPFDYTILFKKGNGFEPEVEDES